MSDLTKIVLSEQDIPTHWYNLNADLPAAWVEVPPPLHPATLQPVGPEDLAPLFPMALIEQEVSTERYIEIPDEVRDIYRLWRPSPLYRRRVAGRRRWIRRLRSIISMKASARRAATSRIRRGAGLLQQGSGRQADHHRDRSRAVGQCAGLGSPVLWDRMQSLHGAHQL